MAAKEPVRLPGTEIAPLGRDLLDPMGWGEAARLIETGISRAISHKRVINDFHRLMDGATLLECSEFGDPRGHGPSPFAPTVQAEHPGA